MKYLALMICLLLVGCQSHQIKPLCRHIVLAQYAACKDAGYETELVHLKNRNPGTHLYHVAVRIKTRDGWQWVEQPEITFTTTKHRPQGTDIMRKLKFSEVVDWTKNRKPYKQIK
jgi:hypothetical protein